MGDPMRTLAKEFGMSDVALAKICRRHNIPIPRVEEETVRSELSEPQKNDIQQVVEWIRRYADTVDPLFDLPEAIEEFVRPESKYSWLE